MERAEGFSEFVIARGPALSRSAYLLTGDHQLAEDLVQTALARAATHWHRISGGNPEAYIRRVMLNERTSWWRRRRYAVEVPTPADVLAAYDGGTVPDHTDLVLRRAAMNAALSRLPARQRAVIVLRFYEDLTEAQAAEALGCSVGTVKSQTNAALAKLRALAPAELSDHPSTGHPSTGHPNTEHPSTEVTSMSAQLRGLLIDLANQAPNYADSQRAMVDARLRRNRRRVVAPIVAFLAVAVLVAVPVLSSYDRPAAPVDTGVTLPGPVAGYPTRAVPPQDAEPLPYAPLGSAAAFVYAPCARDCAPYLVLSDGRQYGLDGPPFGPPASGYTISPDGVWLGWSADGGFQLRNLATGRAHFIADSTLGVTDAWAWSPDSSQLLLGRHVDGTVDHYLLVDVAALAAIATPSGNITTFLLYPLFLPGEFPGTPYAVRNDGDIVVWASGGGGDELPTLAIVDSDTRTERARFTLQMPPDSQLLRPGESLQFGPFFLGPSDDTGLVVIGALDALSVLRETGYVGVDLAAGRIVGRNDLPVPELRVLHDDEVWHVVANLGGGVLLIHRTSDRTEIVQMNDVTGVRTIATTLPVDSQVVVPGGARFST